MAYDDNYIDKVTMRGNCDVDSTGVGVNELPNDAPGQPAGCKFLAPGEPATTQRANRTRLQLAENCDILKARLDSSIATAEVAALAAFSGGSITIDPTGGAAGDINFSGSVYLGTGYADNQENRDSLFQLLDENYNEVVIDGTEVKVTAVGGGAVGGGFYSAGMVTLTLSHTLPSGNYRLGYSVGATLATLPDDALIKADIRGLHEAAGESQRINSYICAIDTAEGPADFVGASAVEDALTNLPGVFGGEGFILYVRSGTYTLPASWPSGAENITVIGTGGTEYVKFTRSNALDIDNKRVRFENVNFELTTGVTLTISDDYCSFRNCWFTADTPNGTESVNTTSAADKTLFDHCFIAVKLSCAGSGAVVSNCLMVGYGTALEALAGVSGLRVLNTTIQSSGTAAGAVVDLTGESYQIEFDNVSIIGTGVGDRAFEVSGDLYESTFRSCIFFGGDEEAAYFSSCNGHMRFDGCWFYTASTTDRVVYTQISSGITFSDCRFQIVGAATEQVAELNGDPESPIVLNNCRFVIDAIRNDASEPDVELTDCQVNGLYLDYNVAYDGTTPALKLNLSRAERVQVTLLTGVDQQNVTGANGCVHVSGSRVDKLTVENMRARWQMPAVFVEGSSLTNQGEVRRLQLSPQSSSWYNYDTPFVMLGDFSLLAEFQWFGVTIVDPGGGNYNMAVIGSDVTENVIHLRIEDCRILIDSPQSDYILNSIRLGIGHSVDRAWIKDCEFRSGDPFGGLAYDGTPGQGSTLYCVSVDRLLVQGCVFDHGLISGGSAPSETTYGTAIYLFSDCERTRIMDNELGAHVPLSSPSNGESKIVYHSGLGAFGGVKTEATLVSGNIFRDLNSGGATPLLGNPNGSGNAQFDGDPDNNNVYCTD